MENKRKITAEEVITKIKDDGDFDRLRLKIVRTLKDDGGLRSNIVSMVQQSGALNRPGAESMKPRQLSDAINQEIGNKVMSQISDGIWKVIGDQMKTEITETVQLVYSKLLKPKMNEHDGSSSHSILNQHVAASEREPNEPPGFSLHDRNCDNGNGAVDQTEEKPRMPMPCNGKARVDVMKETTSSLDASEPDRALPGLPEVVKPMQSNDDVDDDPDVPPGFG